MSNPSTFWKSVEAIGQGVRETALKGYAGEMHDRLYSYLMPSPQLAAQIACERTLEGHGCCYRIVEEPEPDGTYAAVCDEHYCSTKFFTRKELVRYTINPQIMLPVIARCLELHPQVAPVTDHCWQIGQVPGTVGAVPVLFTRVKTETAMGQVLQSLILAAKRRFVLITPTSRHLGSSCLNLLALAQSHAMSLDEATWIDDSHVPVLTEAGRARWQKIKRSLGGASALGATFPTPPEAAWHDLLLVFRDGHTVAASIGSIRETYTFQDMGMVNQNTLAPDEQWQLLYHFGEEMGTFTWRNKHADQRNKKRKERLASRLKAFFGIPGNPFTYRKEDGGWETVFNVRIG